MNNDSSVARVASGIRARVRELTPGAQLPSTRDLCAAEQVSPVTVQKAVRLLVGEGLVETRPGAGNFVARRSAPVRPGDFAWQTTALGPASPVTASDWGSAVRPVAEGTIGLHSTYPAEELLPASMVSSALARVARSEAAFQAAPGQGLAELRAWFAAELNARSPEASPYAATDVIVVAGGQGAIAATYAALTQPGDAIVMESPTFWGGIAAARSRGLDVVPIARTDGGIDPADLDRALAESGARLVYAQPLFANPTGQSYSSAVRREVLEVLAEHKAFFLEDDWARDFAMDLDLPPALASDDPHGHVVYVRSLTKSLSPSIRIGAVIARGPARARIDASRLTNEPFVSNLLQHAALDVLREPAWARHHARLAGRLRDRRDALIRALHDSGAAAEVTSVPRGGLSLWVRIADDLDSTDVASRCLRAGLALSAGPEWFPAEPDGQYLRLSYANADPARFPEAAAILASAL